MSDHFSCRHALCGGPPTIGDGVYDLVVVGGGIVGLATAREVAMRHPHMRIALVEKEKELGNSCFLDWPLHTLRLLAGET